MKKSRFSGLGESLSYMVPLARRTQPRVLIHLAILTLGTVMSGVFSLYAIPRLVACLERHAPLASLVQTALFYSVGLMLSTGVVSYVTSIALCPRITVRSAIIEQVMRKYHTTSFENLLDPAFTSAYHKTSEHVGSNSQPAEHIWTTLGDLLPAAILFVIYLVVLIHLPPWLLVLVLLSTGLSYYFRKQVQDYEYGQRQAEQDILKRLDYAIDLGLSHDYAKDIRLFGMKDWLREIRRQTERTLNHFQAGIGRRYLRLDLLDLLFAFLRNGLAYACLIALIARGELSAAEFLLYFQSFTELTRQATSLLELFTQLRRESDGIREILEFLHWEEPFNFSSDAPAPAAPMPGAAADAKGRYRFTFEGVSYRYPEAKEDTVHDLSFSIEAGEKLAIVGLNGAGKTTLIRLLCGFLDPTAGRVLLNGRDIREFNRASYYEIFSVVFQQYSLLAGSIEVNITQGAPLDDAKFNTVLKDSGLDRVLQRLEQGAQSLLLKGVFPDAVELSGGETQTLMLARALYRDAPVLVLDEPTAALDPLAESAMYEKYNQLCRGKTSVFISHRLASTRFCDRILVLRDGGIIESGTHQELMQKGGFYHDLYQVQSRYYQENYDKKSCYKGGSDTGDTGDADAGKANDAREPQGARDFSDLSGEVLA